MATKEEYEAALFKAEKFGLSTLTDKEAELLKTLYKEAGHRGNRARRLIDGK